VVPDDLSVIGFDNLDLCAYVTPKLTTIAQDIGEKAATAVRMPISSVEGGKQHRKPVTIGVELVEHASPDVRTRARHVAERAFFRGATRSSRRSSCRRR
jgi:DNA-binding LacI/PurR family transcriptional regulator